MSAWVWTAVALVGGMGACGRFVLDALISQGAGRAFPVGTFTVNATGALVLGLLTGLAVAGSAMVIVGSATIGSFTTFSTWMFETHRLAEDGESPHATVNVLLSLGVGFGAAALGRAIGAHA